MTRAEWSATGDPDIDRVTVLEALHLLYRPDGMAIWMESPNQLLDGQVPSEMVADGEAQRVLDLIQALCEGVIF